MSSTPEPSKNRVFGRVKPPKTLYRIDARPPEVVRTYEFQPWESNENLSVKEHVTKLKGSAMFLRKSWISRWSFLLALFLGGILSGAVLTGTVMASQPHMEAALENLYAARQQLSTAAHNKGGHRVNAIKLVNEAISETKEGIAAAKR
ncbi:hypothetical protein [Nostoc sp.]|uniref:hypothetical protein n=1 Tax=Nostoc sp. TaxID=1180 RepID=UPI002FF7516F